MNKARFLTLLIIPALLLVILSLRKVDLGSLAGAVSGLTLSGVLALACLNGLILLLFGIRWRVLLQAQGYTAPFLAVLAYRLAGFGVSYFTPGPQFGGEPLQVHLLRRRHGIPLDAAISVVGMDKLVEMVANFSFLVLGAWIALQSQISHVDSTRTFVTAILLLAFPGIYLALLRTGAVPISMIIERIFRGKEQRPRWVGQAACAEKRLVEITRERPGSLAAAAGLSILVWGLMIAEYWFSLRLLGAPLTFPQAIAALLAARVAFLMPLPGGLGTLEMSQILVLQSFGLPAGVGLALSLLIRARDVLLGGAGLVIAGWSAGLPVVLGKARQSTSLPTPEYRLYD